MQRQNLLMCGNILNGHRLCQNSNNLMVILGGSFNPPHAGHVFISHQAKKLLKCKLVYWLPSPCNPLKITNISNISNIDGSEPPSCQDYQLNTKHNINNNIQWRIKHRTEQVRQFIKPYSYIKLLDNENKLNRGKTAYSYITIKRLSQHYKKQIIFIIGEDNLVNFHLWKQPQEILKYALLLVFKRPMAGKMYNSQDLGSNSTLYKNIKNSILYKKHQNKFIFMNIRTPNISSTEIRNMRNNINAKR